LIATQGIRVRSGRHSVEEELLPIGVDDSDKQDVERVEGQLVVASVTRDEGHGRRSSRFDRPNVPVHLANVVTKLFK
jgi:hypothetical protein